MTNDQGGILARSAIRTHDLRVHFTARQASGSLWGRKPETVHAVDGVSLTVGVGDSVAVVGETGSGKSTLARAVLGLVRPTSGEIWVDGTAVHQAEPAALRRLRKRVALVAQDPFDALNPRQKVEEILALPLRVHGLRGDVRAAMSAALEDVGLRPNEYLSRYPHEMSGGQRQRVAIARALMLSPDLLVADEPVTALDMSVRAQILNLLRVLKDKYGMTYVVVAHDLGMVRYLAARVVVMYLGVVVEDAHAEAFFSKPLHPYSRALVAAVPTLQRRNLKTNLLTSEPPSPIHIPKGCRFHPRCPFATERCRAEVPVLRPIDDGSLAACHHAEAISQGVKPARTEATNT